MRPSFRAMRRQTAGFSLVEIMVGLVIGMFSIIVMLQLFSLSEERKRTTTGGSDAMSEGDLSRLRHNRRRADGRPCPEQSQQAATIHGHVLGPQ